MDIYDELIRLRKLGQKSAIATIVQVRGSIPSHESAKLLVREDGSMLGTIGGGCVEAEVWNAAREVIATERARHMSFNLGQDAAYDNGLICGGQLDVFVEAVVPPPRAYIFGAGHISKSLSTVITMAGFSASIIDNRETFANRDRFPEATEIFAQEYEEVFPQLAINDTSYLVIVTRGHRDDMRVLRWAVNTDARYIAMIGSKRKTISVVRELEKEGLPRELFTKVFAHFGIVFHFVDMNDISALNKLVNAKTKMLWVETPTNPMMKIIDIGACAEISKKHNLILVVDNTFASPFLQTPLDLGANIVMHSVTKYISGHSDLIMGATCTNDDSIQEQLAFIANSCGAVPGPMDSFLVLRGIKTLHLRMERHCTNGKAIAMFLKSHPKVDKVHWPGFPDHPNHALAKKQMRDFGGMISFTLKGNSMEEAFKMASRTKVFSLAESLGGVESLIGHPASMTHASIPKEIREKAGVVDSLLRLSVGVEDIDDLIDDLKQAIG